MQDIIMSLYGIRNLLEQVEVKGSANMLSLVTAVANLNETIKKLENGGETDVQD